MNLSRRDRYTQKHIIKRLAKVWNTTDTEVVRFAIFFLWEMHQRKRLQRIYPDASKRSQLKLMRMPQHKRRHSHSPPE